MIQMRKFFRFNRRYERKKLVVAARKNCELVIRCGPAPDVEPKAAVECSGRDFQAVRKSLQFTPAQISFGESEQTDARGIVGSA
jgi:hypothetical protein